MCKISTSIVFATFFFASFNLWADTGDIPKVKTPHLPKSGSTAEQFVLQGWKLESQEQGDLNNDGTADLVMVLRQDDANNLVKNDGYGVPVLDTNPRILAVAFCKSSTAICTLALENNTLIPLHEDPVMEDPFHGVAIVKNILTVSLGTWMSAGSWGMSNSTFKFRFEKECFRLIGFDYSEMNRATLDTSDTSVNYLTGKIKYTTGNGSTDKLSSIEWGKLSSNKKLCLEDIGDGLEYSPK